MRTKDSIKVEGGHIYALTPFDKGKYAGIRCGIHTITEDGTGVEDSGWLQLTFGKAYFYKMPDSAQYCRIVFSFSKTSAIVTTGDTEITEVTIDDVVSCHIKLEKGTKATDWTPAPEDLASSDDLESLTTRVTESESNITQLSNKITAEVSERTALGTKVSSLEQTASGFTARLTSAEGNISTAKTDIDILNRIATKSYGISGASGKKQWFRLGTLISQGDASNFVITVYSGGGYNGNSAQNSKAEIVIKDAWQSSQSTTKAFGVSVTRQNCDSLKVKVLASAYNTCEVWLYFPWEYWNGKYSIAGRYNSWAHSGAYQDSEPTSGTAQDVAYRMNAENASTTATNYLNFSNGGLVIGNLTASTLGRNVLIDSDSVDIRNGTTVLATFAENLIELGKSSTSSVIKLCGGTGKIISEVDTYNGSSYNSLVLFADYITKIKAGQGNAIITASSNGFVKLLAANGSAENYITLFTDHTYFSKKIVIPNGVALYGARTDGTETDMVHMSSANNVILGYGSYANGVGRTHLYGNMLRFYVKTANTSYKPYYEADVEDGISDTWVIDGYISASALRVYFTIPLGKPIIGNPTVAVSSMNGLIVRQNGNYVYGSAASTYVQPSRYIASIVGGNCIHIIAVFADKTNAVTNYPCSVNASLAIEFS